MLGAYEPEASGVGEILAADTFYSYEAKYFNNESRTVPGTPVPGRSVGGGKAVRPADL